MKRRTTKGKTGSSGWIRSLDSNLSDILIYHGLEIPKDILPIRIFDLLNLYKIDAGRACSIVTSLYHFLNPNPAVDAALQYREISQPFSYQDWNRQHRETGKITVGDVVLTRDMNLKAAEHIFDRVCRAFHRSKEYDSRLYKYASAQEIQSCEEKGGKTV